jgi:5-methylcytosine-specific restriction endonuclease McrA
MIAEKKTIILNLDWTVMAKVSWKQGMLLLMKEAAMPIEYHEGITVRDGNGNKYEVPKVLCLKTFVKNRPRVTPSRKNIIERDNNTCQYCGKTFVSSELTMDHVHPKSKGGERTWQNIVTSCFKCNQKKANRTPEEAGMELLSEPRQLEYLGSPYRG